MRNVFSSTVALLITCPVSRMMTMAVPPAKDRPVTRRVADWAIVHSRFRSPSDCHDMQPGDEIQDVPPRGPDGCRRLAHGMSEHAATTEGDRRGPQRVVLIVAATALECSHP